MSKLVHVVRSRQDLSPDEFAAAWRDEHAAALLAAGATRPGRLVQNLHAEVDKETFKGTLFELAGVGGYAGIEELWFEDLDALVKFTQDAGVRAAVLSEDGPVDPAGSFSLVVTERVVYDYTLGDAEQPGARGARSGEPRGARGRPGVCGLERARLGAARQGAGVTRSPPRQTGRAAAAPAVPAR